MRVKPVKYDTLKKNPFNSFIAEKNYSFVS